MITEWTRRTQKHHVTYARNYLLDVYIVCASGCLTPEEISVYILCIICMYALNPWRGPSVELVLWDAICLATRRPLVLCARECSTVEPQHGIQTSQLLVPTKRYHNYKNLYKSKTNFCNMFGHRGGPLCCVVYPRMLNMKSTLLLHFCCCCCCCWYSVWKINTKNNTDMFNRPKI